MPLEPLIQRSFGTVGNNQAAAVAVTNIGSLGPGRYRVSGTVRHTLADGVRLIMTGASNLRLVNGANQSQDFGPIIVEFTGPSNNILLELDQATGAADTASANLYVQKINI